MTNLRCLYSIAVFMLAMSLVALAAGRATPLRQKPQIQLDKAVAYPSAGAFADSVTIADLRGDGRMDLVLTNDCQTTNQGSCNAPGEVAVLLGNGDGTFQPAVTYSTGAYFAFSVAVGDVNGDGRPDIVVANLCQSVYPYFACVNGSPGEISVLLGNGDGTFRAPATYDSGGLFATSVAIGDVNGDGRLDLVVANGGTSGGNNGSVAVLLGNGDGTFQSAVAYSSNGYSADSVAIADLNGDGNPDLVVANWCQYSGNCDVGGGAGVLLGNGDGTFQPVITYSSGGIFSYSVAVADLKGDGIRDLVVANQYSVCCNTPDVLGVLLGNGDGTFQSAVTYASVSWGYDAVAIGDVNGDGRPDLVMVEECQTSDLRSNCIGTGRVNVMLGNGDGTFRPPVTYGSGGYKGSSVVIADVNGDGRPDIVVTNGCGSDASCNSDGSVAVLLNKTSYTTTTALTSSPNPSKVNQEVTFTASITSDPAVPNGEVVTYYNGTKNLGTGKTSNGVATLTISFSKAGTDTIKAKYSGDPFRKPSAGTVKQVVNP